MRAKATALAPFAGALAIVLLVAGPPGSGPTRAAAQDPAHGTPDEHADAEHHSHESSAEHLGIYDEITVRERAADLARRLPLRAGDIVETVPGMVATQHSGGGKANQYYLRGFNLDHGTDFSVSVAGDGPWTRGDDARRPV